METPFTPDRALVVVAHPDDAEFMVAGTAAKWAAAGADVTYAIVTKGDKGSEDPEMTPTRLAAIRADEQRQAARVLGVRQVEFLGYEDGYLQHTLALRRDITRLVRQYRPDVVVTFDPTNRWLAGTYPNHPDHRATGDATVDAVFPSARDRLTFPELLTEGLMPHKTPQLWLGNALEPDIWVDISATMERKKEALRAHPSQFGEEIIQFIEVMAGWTGQPQGLSHAEAFRRIIFDQPRVERFSANEQPAIL